MWLLRRLLDAVKGRTTTRTVMVGATKGARVTHERPGHGLEALSHQAPAKGDGKPCKVCPGPVGTPNSISYATGAESFTHTDFELPAPLPITWRRSYRSQFIAGDGNPLGARWLNGYCTRVDVVQGRGSQRRLAHHGADGRSHSYPWIEVGRTHRDAIEEVTLSRTSATRLQLDFGPPMPNGEPSPWCEVYELVDAPARGTEASCSQHFRLVSQHAPQGLAIELRYDAHGLCALQSLQGEQVHAQLRVECNAQTGHIQRLWEVPAASSAQPERLLASYTHDAAGDLIEAQDENGASWQYTYRSHLVTRYTDRTGRGINLRYDHYADNADNGKTTLPKAIREWSDDGSQDTQLAWDPNIRLTYVTDALGHETWVYVDIHGYPYRIVHPDFQEEWFFRDAAKNVVRHVHPDGSADAYTHDAFGNLVRHLRPDGCNLHFEYDAAHRLSRILDPEENIWQRGHNPQGLLSEETDPLGHKTSYAYDKAGRLIETLDAQGGASRLTYTPRGQLASHTDCSGRRTAWRYDARGRLIERTDAAGHTTQYRYTPSAPRQHHAAQPTTALTTEPASATNAPGQLEAIVHADGSEERLVHDAEGRLLSHTDALQRQTRYRYDRAGRIEQRVDALGHRLSYEWDRLGRLTELRNENGQPYRFTYDPVGRLLEEQGFDQQRTEYRYAEDTGRLAEVIEGQARTQLRFDPMGRLLQRSAQVNGIEQTERYGYYADGRLGEAINEHARLSCVYDAAGNLTREHHQYTQLGRTAVWHHRYNALNQRTGSTRPDGHTLEWLTYGSGHVHGLVLDGEEVVGFERDALHREVHRMQANGLQQTQRYDPRGRLLEQQLVHHRQPVTGAAQMGQGPFQLGHHGTQLGQSAAILRRYRYDDAGQLEHIEDNRRGRYEYRYDPVGRLLSAVNGHLGGKETFAFDPAGNLVGAQPDEWATRRTPLPKLLDNLLKDYAGSHYRHDERGNLVERMHQGERSAYAWDGFNRLIEATTPRGKTRYAYDALGRRIGKRFEAHSVTVAGTPLRQEVSETLYGWDGDTLAFESQSDGFKGHSVHYVHEAGSFVPLLQARRAHAMPLPPMTDIAALKAGNFGQYDMRLDPLWNGELEAEAVPFKKEEIAFYQCDHLGTPQELTDHEGRVAWEASFKAWGQARVAISEAARQAGLANPIRFQGQYLDDETGLHYNRYRYYDPVIGRFISKDPIGLAGGLNLHLYAPNPNEWVDPLGLTPCLNENKPSIKEKILRESPGLSSLRGNG